MKKVLVVGLGEIGLPIYQIIARSQKFELYGIDKSDDKNISDPDKIFRPIDYLHICVPCSNQQSFKNIVLDYVCKYEPSVVIVHSTTPPLTTLQIHAEAKRISPYVAHSPVRGMHSNMLYDLATYNKYVGGADQDSGKRARDHLIEAGFKAVILGTSTETELAKIFETSYTATMIATFQEMHRISREFDADFSRIIDIFIDTHKHRLDRPLWYPAPIGGHCLMPNIALLNSSCHSTLFRWVWFSNGLRDYEINDADVKAEVERIKAKFNEMRKWSKEKLGNEVKE